MTTKQSIRLALDVLEKEMLVLSSSEILNVLGGSGSPMPDGYCTMNDISFNLSQLGVNTSAENVFFNFANTQGLDSLSFRNNGTLKGITTGAGSDHDDFRSSIFNMTNLNDCEEIFDKLVDGKTVALSGTNGHAYTATGWDADKGKFIVRDTTTGLNNFVNEDEMELNFKNAKSIDSIKANVFGSSGSWSNNTLNGATVPTSTGSSTGN